MEDQVVELMAPTALQGIFIGGVLSGRNWRCHGTEWPTDYRNGRERYVRSVRHVTAPGQGVVAVHAFVFSGMVATEDGE